MTYQHNTLQDCLTECARIETARANCISAMNAVGIVVPADASLGVLPQYFKYAGQQESHIPITPSTPISFDNANTAIDNVEIDKRNLKAAINNFCKPTGRQITDDSIDEYYTYIQAVSGIDDLNVEYIENLNSDASTYIQLDIAVGLPYDTEYSLKTKVSWGGIAPLIADNSLVGVITTSRNSTTGEDTGNGYTYSGIALTKVNDSTGTVRVGLNTNAAYLERDLVKGPNTLLNTPHTLDYLHISRGMNFTCKLDNVVYSGEGVYGHEYSKSIFLKVFNASGKCPSGSRVYYIGTTDSSSVTTHNLIPKGRYINGNWEGYLYDTVTGKNYYSPKRNTIGIGKFI